MQGSRVQYGTSRTMRFKLPPSFNVLSRVRPFSGISYCRGVNVLPVGLPRFRGGSMAQASLEDAADHLSKVIENKEEYDKLIKDKEDELKSLQIKLDQETKKYQDEIKKLNFQLVKPEDVVEINVSGELMTTTRRTLMQVEGSLLEAMFSGRWEGSLTRDKEGRVFLDCDPRHMSTILGYLRGRQVDKEEAQMIWRDKLSSDPTLALVWKGLVGTAAKVPIDWSWGPTGGKVSWVSRKKVSFDLAVPQTCLQTINGSYCSFAASSVEMEEGHVYSWQLMLEGDTSMLFLGIDSAEGESGGWSRGQWFNGWARGDTYKNGLLSRPDVDFYELLDDERDMVMKAVRGRNTKQNKLVFKLDLILGQLTMRGGACGNSTVSINVPVDQKWRVFAALVYVSSVHSGLCSGFTSIEIQDM